MRVTLDKNDLQTGQLQWGMRPAVIAVDFSNGFTSKQNPLGGDFSSEIAVNIKLAKLAQEFKVPMFFSTVVYDQPEQASVFRQRLPALNTLQRGSHWVEIHKDLAPYVQTERLIEKHHPSAFFNTNLKQRLVHLKIDSLVITGLTTSGCVRATCVDGLQHNFLCSVLAEGCSDRNQDAHKMSLHDMHAKYAQVISFDDVQQWFSQSQ